jgi:surfactin synthase thioesterase subunit
MQGWLADSVPLVLLGHSFGTLFAYECAEQLRATHAFDVQHVISLAGVSFDYLCTLPIYQDTYDAHDKEGFERLFQEEARSVFGEVPDFVREGHPSYNAAMKANTVQGSNTKSFVHPFQCLCFSRKWLF